MKRYAVLVAVWLLLSVVVLFAWQPQQSAPAESRNYVVIGMSQVGAESDWRVANSESMKSVFTEENGYQLLFDDARQKQENQIAAVRKFIQQRVDYIVIMPIGENGWDSVMREARDAGIPVILVDRMVDIRDPSLITAHVGADFYAEGQRAVGWLEDRFAQAEQVNIVHIQGTEGSSAQLGRTRALMEAMEENENWNLLAQLNGDFTQAKTYEVILEYLNTEGCPPIDVVYCENDNEAFGAIEALESMGYTCGEEGVTVVSFDATRHALELCLEGKIAMDAECNPLLGPLVEQVVQTLESGGTPEKNHYIEERYFVKEDLSEEFIAGRMY